MELINNISSCFKKQKSAYLYIFFARTFMYLLLKKILIGSGHNEIKLFDLNAKE